jgi:hypothetical protein
MKPNDKEAIWTGGADAPLRLSTFLKRMRHAKAHDTAAALELDQKLNGNYCIRHGHLDDPICVITEDNRVVFGCAHCSGSFVLEQYESEPERMCSLCGWRPCRCGE